MAHIAPLAKVSVTNLEKSVMEWQRSWSQILHDKHWVNAFLLTLLSIFLVAGCDSEADTHQPDQILKRREVIAGACEITQQQEHMLALINQARSEARSCGDTDYQAVPPLTWNCQLRDAAIAHNNDMIAHNFFAHTGSDGLRAGDRITATGYNWRYYGENLAAGYVQPEDALAGLLDSPGHCKNIMSPNVTEFGSYREFAENLDYQSYWTHVFAKPM